MEKANPITPPEASAHHKFNRISNKVRYYRENQLMSRAELARKAGVSPITLSRVEEGFPSRLDTKRKILLALGLNISDKNKVFLDLES
jgi:transcriptional regulator with XRE-family HTH domain